MLTPQRFANFNPKPTSYELRILNEHNNLAVIAPTHWSQRACFMTADKYARDTDYTTDPNNPDDPTRYPNISNILTRVANTIGAWLNETFPDEPDAASIILNLLEHQYFAFNSPVYFNVGAEEHPQASACFILGLEDSMEDILEWYRQEGLIFKGGSGAGVNVSNLRGSNEHLSGSTNTSSGPIGFILAADHAAGAIKSGGRNRRAAKMVIMDDNHPDVLDFLNVKRDAERVIHGLNLLGEDVSFGSKLMSRVIPFQNANFSIAWTDDTMRKIQHYLQTGQDDNINLTNRTDGQTVGTIAVSDYWDQFTTSQHECGDPGSFFIDTANQWNTLSHIAPIRGTNPCSEFVNIDNTACNLASINLVKFITPDRRFDAEHFADVARYVLMCQEVLIDYATYPTKAITTNTRKYRQLGLGYTNLGYTLAALGIPYSQGAETAGLITALMHFAATDQSIRMAQQLGSYTDIDPKRQRYIVQMHISEYDRRHRNPTTPDRDPLHQPIRATIEHTIKTINKNGGGKEIRNSQLTLLAPTGTISFMMDAETTGIEPVYALINTKMLVGKNGQNTILRTVSNLLRAALTATGRTPETITQIEQHLISTGALPDILTDQERELLRGAEGNNPLEPDHHLYIMAACQPFLSGAISKTVNLPLRTSPETVGRIHLRAWELGLKAVTTFRTGSKFHSILFAGELDEEDKAYLKHTRPTFKIAQDPIRYKPTGDRVGVTFSQEISGETIYFTVNTDSDGNPIEVFITSKGGPIPACIAAAKNISTSLQYGIPLNEVIDNTQTIGFEPSGPIYGHPRISSCTSPVDFLLKELAFRFLSDSERHSLGIFSKTERAQQLDGQLDAPLPHLSHHTALITHAEPCQSTPGCDGTLQQSGSCKICNVCGTTTGCS